MIRRQVVFLLLLGVLFSPSSFAAGKVVLEADIWCPHTCPSGTDQPGYMVEIARAALELSGYVVEYRTASWARTMSDVRSGAVDGAVGSLREEAAGLVVPATPIGRQSNVFLVRADDGLQFDGLHSLAGRRVGAVVNYSYSVEIDAWLAANAAWVERLAGDDTAGRNLRRLDSGRISVLVEDEAVINKVLRQHPYNVRAAGRMAGGGLHVVFTPVGGRGGELAAALDKGIAQLRASGELSRILGRYGVADWQ